jgi:hypothetical protein
MIDFTRKSNLRQSPPTGCDLLFENREGHFRSCVSRCRRTQVVVAVLAGDLNDPDWPDESSGIAALSKTLDSLDALQPAMVLFDLSDLTEIGVWGLSGLEATFRSLSRSGSSMMMVLNPDLDPAIVCNHLLTWMEQAVDVPDGVLRLYLERYRAA